ncbi:hypothetical protein Ae201684P_009648 [Aphanomyces euteiches]|uniref:Uncharacterized protein n=1 Tax=Aphanomyces euteiches TaxID=100861 RepID=A0A6G0XGF6_9STRA|nr:hypothetical protein Ae201684_004895 [Aphanomyces euteiches]KAH9082322.1 hypothetical protein Ae201684P_009648 [Aphanomyces euteiches]
MVLGQSFKEDHSSSTRFGDGVSRFLGDSWMKLMHLSVPHVFLLDARTGNALIDAKHPSWRQLQVLILRGLTDGSVSNTSLHKLEHIRQTKD